MDDNKRAKRSSIVRLLEWLKATDDTHWDMGDVMKAKPDFAFWFTDPETGRLVQRDTLPYCQTAGCFAGHCNLLQMVFEDEKGEQVLKTQDFNRGGRVNRALEFLGVDDIDDSDSWGIKDWLFFPGDVDYTKVTRQNAIALLENILETSRIDWGKVMDIDTPAHEIELY